MLVSTSKVWLSWDLAGEKVKIKFILMYTNVYMLLYHDLNILMTSCHITPNVMWIYSFYSKCKLENVIIHFFLFCFDRLIQLMEEIMAEKENKTIIFVETKKRCDDLTRRMRRDGWVPGSGSFILAKKKVCLNKAYSSSTNQIKLFPFND